MSIDPEVVASIARSTFLFLGRRPRNSTETVAFVSMTVRFPDIPWRTPIVVQLYREDWQTVGFETSRILGEPPDLARRLAAYDLVPDAADESILAAEQAAKLARRMTIDCQEACTSSLDPGREIPVGFCLGGPGPKAIVSAEWELGRREADSVFSVGKTTLVAPDYRLAAFADR